MWLTEVITIPAIQYSHWAFVFESYKHNLMNSFKLQEIDYFIQYFEFKIFMAIYMHTIFIHVKEICNCLCKSVWINLFMKFPWKSSWWVLQWWGKHEVMVRRWPNDSEQDNFYTIKSFNDIFNYVKFEILKEYMKNICKLWIVRKDPHEPTT